MKLPDDQKRRLLALIHIAKKQLRLSDDDYRSIVFSQTGSETCKDLDLKGLNAVLRRLQELGFKTESSKKLSPKTRDKAEGEKTQVDKIRAMWIDLANRGLLRNRYEDGLRKFVKRVTGCDRLEWVTPKEANLVIEALKAIEERGKTDATNG